MPPEPSATAAAPEVVPVLPLPERAAAAILGSMILLIVALTFVLVQITWVNPVSASESPAVEAELAVGR